MPTPIVLVTGANRGIGLEIVRQLAQRGAVVILTARKSEAGQAALAELEKQGLRARFHALDVTSADSIDAVRAYLDSAFGRLDVLINNAGIFIKEDRVPALEIAPDIIRATFETNTLAPLRLAQAMAPLLKKSSAARIINVSSGLGAISDMGAGNAAYRISKAALNAATRILAAELKDQNIAVNAMCPGWVRTDMGGPTAPRDVAQGADTAVWLALDAPQVLTNEFLRDRKPIAW